jgi:alpha-ketoglutarate-dependent taurine dioxygenase
MDANVVIRIAVPSPNGTVVFLELVPFQAERLHAVADELVAGRGDAETLAECLRPLARACELETRKRDGLAVLRNLPCKTEGAALLVTEALTSLLGTPLRQSADRSELVGRVEAEPAAGAGARVYRGYRDASEQMLHTDTPAQGLEIDEAMMVCVRPARNGGASRFLSAQAAVDRLSEAARTELSKPIPFSCAREWVSDWGGKGPTGSAPLVATDAHGRRTLEFGAILRANVEGAGAAPAGSALASVLDELAHRSNQEGAFTRLRLASGEAFVVDNRRWLHARDAFEDDGVEAGAARLLLRVWLRRHAAGGDGRSGAAVAMSD